MMKTAVMSNKSCFVQFPHPGTEHDIKSGSDWNKNVNNRPHRRKFMQFSGKWIEEDGKKGGGDLWAWGEWEAESILKREFKDVGVYEEGSALPRYLWEPEYAVRSNYDGLHNTDPFIFGESFLYSNCKQRTTKTNKATNLQNLERGSVIVFGSGKGVEGERKWMLDTVFVVSEFVDYDPLTMRMKVEDKWEDLKFKDDWIPPGAFYHVVVGPFGYKPRELNSRRPETGPTHRLYRGATPDDCVDGMYSFFPTIPAKCDLPFARPFVDFGEGEKCHLNPRFWQGTKGATKDLDVGKRVELWTKLVDCVFKRGLFLGTHGAIPERRE